MIGLSVHWTVFLVSVASLGFPFPFAPVLGLGLGSAAASVQLDAAILHSGAKSA